jgi:hypothetical protein
MNIVYIKTTKGEQANSRYRRREVVFVGKAWTRSLGVLMNRMMEKMR